MSDTPPRRGPLIDLRVVELAGIGPGPLCAMLLADLGADVVRIDRPRPSGLGVAVEGRTDVLRRGRPSVAVDLKDPRGVETVLRLVERADALIEPFRPGVAERIGLGPDVCLERSPRLVYGRMTGWGQSGPLAGAAGHDLNYLAITGALAAIGPRDLPMPPLNLVADMGGGALFLAVGLLAGVQEARRSGAGQVVDAAMFEGAAYLAAANFGWLAAGLWRTGRESNFLDGAAPYYRCYRTADDRFVAVAAIEPKFWRELLERIGLDPGEMPEQNDRSRWPQMCERLAARFRTRTRDEWCERLEGTDACFAPVLGFDEAPRHPQARARESFVEVAGVTQPAPAPRFSRTPGAVAGPPPGPGADTEAALAAWGLPAHEIAALREAGVVGWRG